MVLSPGPLPRARAFTAGSGGGLCVGVGCHDRDAVPVFGQKKRAAETDRTHPDNDDSETFPTRSHSILKQPCRAFHNRLMATSEIYLDNYKENS